tara:strand:- start:502 stop:1023 length:522 start_codon:yes stop_codon:yes gene_type:complete
MAKHLAYNMSNYLSPLGSSEPKLQSLMGMGLPVRPIDRSTPDYNLGLISQPPNPAKKAVTDIIKHELIDLLGETTNNLIFCFLDNNMAQRFTRVEIREAVERHVAELARTGTEKQHLPRIQTGKAAVNYWIDRLVERNSLNKEHSKPVLFWRTVRYSNASKNLQMYSSVGVGR